MFIFSILFLLGVLTLQLFKTLPSAYFSIAIIFIIGLCFLFNKKNPYIKFIIPYLLGFAWVLWYSHLQLSWTLPDEQEGKTLKATGIITSIPNVEHQKARFKFLIKKIQFENEIKKIDSTVQLSWNSASKNLRVGDEWQFTVHLKKIKSNMNPGSFDFETWCFQEGIRATGYIIEDENIFLASHWYHHPIDRAREYLRDRINENLSKSSTSSLITALTMGERDSISPDDWKILRNTGTNHLMAIAGLHIGFLSAFIFSIVTWIWRTQPKWMLKIPAQHAGAISALIMALIYSAMAGFSMPTQRACLMLSLVLITVLLKRRIVSWHVWSLAMLCVLVFNPLSVLTPSFWLSFGSIALIIYSMRGRLAPSGWWWKHGRIQWVVGIGLIPLSIFLFQECSFISFIANSIAIPCVGFLIIPLTLLGCFALIFSSKIGGILLCIADKVMSLLWMILTYLAHLSWSAWHQFVPSVWYIIIAYCGMMLILLPAGFPGRGFGVIGMLSLILYKSSAPPMGDVWFTLLDVGQGLSAVVQTHNHILVFDAGPRLNDTNDMGEKVVNPFLHSLAITHIDKLVISHGDNDHIGGAAAVLKEFPVYLVESSVPDQFLNRPATYCNQGEKWVWDQVVFEFLYPTSDKLGLNNDSSCVLRITSGLHSILLTGDIEKIAEEYLTNFSANDLRADILVAPHHGSKTSALDEFINDVHPQIVLFPVGYRNRYHFPNPSVVQKYHDLGVVSYDTVQSGAIQFHLSKQNNSISNPILYREDHLHYWQ